MPWLDKYKQSAPAIIEDKSKKIKKDKKDKKKDKKNKDKKSKDKKKRHRHPSISSESDLETAEKPKID